MHTKRRKVEKPEMCEKEIEKERKKERKREEKKRVGGEKISGDPIEPILTSGFPLCHI